MIIVLLRLKFDLGLSLFAGGALTGLCAGLGLPRVLTTLASSCIKGPTVHLLLAIILIMFLAEVASHHGYLERFTRALQKLISDRRVNMCLIPAFGGLLPMPGGAMWSAPLVNSISGDSGVSAEEKTFINYWFRHVWEYVLPLYPGVVVASAILGIPIEKLVIAQAPLSGAAIVSGALVVFWKIKKVDAGERRERPRVRDFADLFMGLWPFAFVIVLVLVFKADLLAVIVSTILIIGLLEKTGVRQMLLLGRRSFSLSTISVILGVMAFKEVMERGGVVHVLPGLLGSLHFPGVLVLFLVPMVVGLLTGITQAFVGVAFPVILPFLNASSARLPHAAVAYAGGFLGVLLSPVHLCLVLTHQYFEARLGGVYLLMIFPAAFVALVALLFGLR
ncbi:MAG: DUF401 family protein [Candidatus Eisenbacteria bacterium]